ncbi:MAG TPA: sugar phosphorylase [Lentisphaeria bacterium]|nr:MAG: hypothetical protein A2X47_00180 [Lentisphaerae bacterium GWF2_38_69]HBM14888.1 sugar phosphorylase [Lentisphaeria bacterium]
MIYDKHNLYLDRVRNRFEKLYDKEVAEKCLRRFKMLVGRYELGVYSHPNPEMWNEKTSYIITYGDSILEENKRPLKTLKKFLDEYAIDKISHVHILPFFPYSSDDGFSVIHYRQINPELGSWSDIKDIGEQFSLMYDLVLNHVSRKSKWFTDFDEGIMPAKKFFISVEKNADLSTVTRPRNLPLLTKVTCKEGEKYLWTTFSEDQIDLNYSNPDLLFEMLDVLLYYIYMGAKSIRLDAIAYLWKKIGTSCVHLLETHEVVKLMRDLLDLVAPDVTIITETNVPQKDNFSYFGEGDEAHMVYQFPLPPLTVHTLQCGDSKALMKWAASLEKIPPKTTFFNFLSSHDGIGVVPATGLLSPEEIDKMIQTVITHKGLISYKANSNGTNSPYEMNVNFLDAISHPDENIDLRAKKMLSAQFILLSFIGVPAIYIHSLLGSVNDLEGVKKTGRNRSINREKLDYSKVVEALNNPESLRSKIFSGIIKLLEIRQQHKAFSTESEQKILNIHSAVFSLVRSCPEEEITALNNISDKEVSISIADFKGTDLISGQEIGHEIKLNPYQYMWIKK